MEKAKKKDKRRDNRGYTLKAGESQRKDGTYMYRSRRSVGKVKDESGKDKYNYEVVTIYAKSLEELREKESQIEKSILDKVDIFSAKKITLNDCFGEWVKGRKIRESTRQNYLDLWKANIENSLGEKHITGIKRMHIESLYRDFEKKGFHKATIKMLHLMIRGSLQFAVDNDLLHKNAAAGVEYGGDTNEKKALTREEQRSLLDFLSGENIYSKYKPIITVFLGTGLRVSELCGLCWSDIDFTKNTIRVDHQLLKRKKAAEEGQNTLYIEKTKTESGIRDIPMTEDVKNALLDQKRINDLLGLKVITPIDNYGGFIFVTKSNRPYTVTDVNFILNNIVKAHNKVNDLQLPHFSAHILRHTAATRMAESGINPKALQMILGHSSIKITMDVYVNLDAENIADEMQKAEGMLNYRKAFA
jgi:integrase